MLKIDDNLLQQIGLGALPAEEKRNLLAHIYETLEMRVGMRLADQMTNEQLDEFEMYFEAKDDAGAFKWLESNFPNYKDIVNEEFEKLKVEVQQSAPQILGAAQANPSAPQAQPPQPQQQLPGDQYAQAPQQQYQQPAPQPQLQPYQPQPQTAPQQPAPDYQPQQLPPQPYAPQPQPPVQPWTPGPAPQQPPVAQQPWQPPTDGQAQPPQAT